MLCRNFRCSRCSDRGGFREAGDGKIRSKFALLNNEKGAAEKSGESRSGFSLQEDRPPGAVLMLWNELKEMMVTEIVIR